MWLRCVVGGPGPKVRSPLFPPRDGARATHHAHEGLAPRAAFRDAARVSILRDPVHGDIELERDELRLVDTEQFQRLRGIKQLGSAALVYPGATHTRFEHSIGTLHVCDRLLSACNRNAARDPECLAVTAAERRVLRAAALLHDVPHIPYGHNLEDQTGL